MNTPNSIYSAGKDMIKADGNRFSHDIIGSSCLFAEVEMHYQHVASSSLPPEEIQRRHLCKHHFVCIDRCVFHSG